MLLAATLRLVALDRIPPAIHADEAPNAWNAYCLLQTGHDQYGVSWPVFYLRALGDYRTTTYAYALIPFQFLGGMNVWTTRLPAAVSGILAVLLMFFIGARLFGATVGLAAAGFLAVNPWHIQVSRWGHEASLTPLFVLASIAALLWANLPLDDREERRPRPVIAGLAGAAIGISLYGYSAIRIFLPCFLAGVLVVTWRGWRVFFASREGKAAIALLVVTLAIFFGPLVWSHLNDPAINERARILGWIWNESDSIAQKSGKVLLRYLDHYGPNFLFLTGDRDPSLSPPRGFGLLHWHDLPLILIGIASLVLAFRKSRAARVLLLWLVLYPVGDILFPHVSSHSLRSLAGVGCLTLIAALGVVKAALWLRALGRRGVAILLASILSGVVLFANIHFMREYFGEEYLQEKSSLFIFSADLQEAARWLKPRLPEATEVFVTGQAAHPDMAMLFGLNYDPREWFREPRELIRGPLPDGRFKDAYIYLGYGKIRFLLNESVTAALSQLPKNDRVDRVIFIVRPGELGLERHARPVQEIRGVNGEPRLWIFAMQM